MDPAEYPARAARQWILPRKSCSPVDPAEYPARAARQWIPPSIPLSIPCRWILPSIRSVSSRSGSPVFASGFRQYPASLVLLNVQRADGNLGSKSPGCGGICCNGRKLVSVEGGDCSKRSILLGCLFGCVCLGRFYCACQNWAKLLRLAMFTSAIPHDRQPIQTVLGVEIITHGEDLKQAKPSKDEQLVCHKAVYAENQAWSTQMPLLHYPVSQ